jgi:hypothetical protein
MGAGPERGTGICPLSPISGKIKIEKIKDEYALNNNTRKNGHF